MTDMGREADVLRAEEPKWFRDNCGFLEGDATGARNRDNATYRDGDMEMNREDGNIW